MANEYELKLKHGQLEDGGKFVTSSDVAEDIDAMLERAYDAMRDDRNLNSITLTITVERK